MYSYVCGELIEKGKDRAIVETKGGIGYELFIADGERARFPSAGDPVKLYTHLYVREDQQKLYGFIKRANRDFFRQLQQLSGVGPSMALAVLSDLGADRFRKAVQEQDLDTLKTIKGVGKKTAQRLIVELAEKLPAQPVAADSGTQKMSEEALEALLGLGFPQKEATRMVKKALEAEDHETLEDLISAALRGSETAS